MSTLPLFAISKLEAFCAGRPEQLAMLHNLVERMIAQLPLDLDKAEAAFTAGDGKSAAACLHAAHGAVAPIGAQRFAAKARAVEQQLDAEGLRALRAILDETLAAAQAWLDGAPVDD